MDTLDPAFFTPEVEERVEACKAIVEHIQKHTSRTDEEWHIYTFRQDKGSDDPARFKICNTKRRNFILATAIVPIRNLLNIYFVESPTGGKKPVLIIEFITKKFNIKSSGLNIVEVIGEKKAIRKLLRPFFMDDWDIEIIEK